MIKKRIFLLLLILIILYFSGFFYRPNLEFLVLVKIPQETLILRDITLYVPFPNFSFSPYLLRPIKEVETSFYVAAKSKNSTASVIDTKFGEMLKINISKLSFADTELGTENFKLHFTQNLPVSYLFTPFYLFKEPDKIYSLKPTEEKWNWAKKEEKVFFAEKKLSTFIYSDFPADEIFLKIKFRIKKRINPFGGYIIVQQEITEENGIPIKIDKKGWQKYNVKELTIKKWF